MPYKKQSILSTQFWGSGGMKGVLKPEREDTVPKARPGDIQVQRGDEALRSSCDGKASLISQQLQRRYNGGSPRGPPQLSEGESALGRAALESARAVVHDDPAAHFTYRQQKAGVQKTFNTKDSCPYGQVEGDPRMRRTREATPHKRVARSHSPNLVGGAVVVDVGSSRASDELWVAERDVEARRDLACRREVAVLEELAQLSPSPESIAIPRFRSAGSLSARSHPRSGQQFPASPREAPRSLGSRTPRAGSSGNAGAAVPRPASALASRGQRAGRPWRV